MAIKTVNDYEISHNIGLSSDTKPHGQAALSTFFEYDTFIPYVTYDGTNWVEDTRITKRGHNITGIGDGVKTVSTVGSDEALAVSTAAKLVIIQAQTDNTNKIAVGATGVDATVATGTGIILDPGDTITLPVDNLNDVYIDALVAGEGVRYVYFS